MKLNALAILAVSSLFAASFAVAAVENTLVDDASAMSGTNGAMSGNVGAVNNDMQTQNSIPSTNPGSAETSNSNDDMSADTATGDDDY